MKHSGLDCWFYRLIYFKIFTLVLCSFIGSICHCYEQCSEYLQSLKSVILKIVDNPSEDCVHILEGEAWGCFVFAIDQSASSTKRTLVFFIHIVCYGVCNILRHFFCVLLCFTLSFVIIVYLFTYFCLTQTDRWNAVKTNSHSFSEWGLYLTKPVSWWLM